EAPAAVRIRIFPDILCLCPSTSTWNPPAFHPDQKGLPSRLSASCLLLQCFNLFFCQGTRLARRKGFIQPQTSHGKPLQIHHPAAYRFKHPFHLMIPPFPECYPDLRLSFR